MSNGPSHYRDLARRVTSQRQTVAELAHALDQLQTQADHAKQQESEETRALAQFRLNAIIAERRRGSDRFVDAVSHQAWQHIGEKTQAQKNNEQAIAASAAQHDELIQQREAAVLTRDARLNTHNQAYAATLEKLQQTPEWHTHVDRAQELAEQTQHATEKAGKALKDRENKGKPYEADKLFTYLWKREYGTDAYQSGGLIRMLDGWVAGLVNYRQASQDYRMLLALPEHLSGHAESLRSQAEQALANQDTWLNQALHAEGITPLREQLDAAEEELARIEALVAQEEAEHNQLINLRRAFAEGSDPHTQAALALLMHDIKNSDSQTLMHEARSTVSSDDDQAVVDLHDARQRFLALQQQLVRLQQEHHQAFAALQRIEALAQAYRQRHYDAGNSTIGGGADWNDTLDGVLNGILDATRAMERISRNQRFELPEIRIPSGGGIRFPSGSGGGIRLPGGGSGGFGTGGGFGGFSGGGGGGGFSTGGGF